MPAPPSLDALCRALHGALERANAQLAALRPPREGGTLHGIPLDAFHIGMQPRLQELALSWRCYLLATRHGPVLRAGPPPLWRRVLRRPLRIELRLLAHGAGCTPAFVRSAARWPRRPAVPLQVLLSPAELAQVQALGAPRAQTLLRRWLRRLTETVTR